MDPYHEVSFDCILGWGIHPTYDFVDFSYGLHVGYTKPPQMIWVYDFVVHVRREIRTRRGDGMGKSTRSYI